MQLPYKPHFGGAKFYRGWDQTMYGSLTLLHTASERSQAPGNILRQFYFTCCMTHTSTHIVSALLQGLAESPMGVNVCHACGGSSLQLVYVLRKSQSFTVLEEKYCIHFRWEVAHTVSNMRKSAHTSISVMTLSLLVNSAQYHRPSQVCVCKVEVRQAEKLNQHTYCNQVYICNAQDCNLRVSMVSRVQGIADME